MRRVEVVGIGCGSPGLLTADAINAIARLNVVIEFDKGEDRADLLPLRAQLLSEFGDPAVKRVSLVDPTRDATAEYGQGVQDWHDRRASLLADALAATPADCVVGILVWGDPALYDSTLRLLARVGERIPLEVVVTPGISSPQLLAARFATPLHRVGAPVLITTGRQLREHGVPDGVDDVVVMLDSGASFASQRGKGFEILWGAYLGMPIEELRAGHLDDVCDQLIRERTELRELHGWVFDVYILRRSLLEQ